MQHEIVVSWQGMIVSCHETTILQHDTTLFIPKDLCNLTSYNPEKKKKDIIFFALHTLFIIFVN